MFKNNLKVSNESRYTKLEGMGPMAPLLLAPAEGLRGPLGPLTCGGNLF